MKTINRTRPDCPTKDPTHPLVLGFWMQTSFHSFHPQLLLGRVHVEKSFSAQVQFLKTKYINQVTMLIIIKSRIEDSFVQLYGQKTGV